MRRWCQVQIWDAAFTLSPPCLHPRSPPSLSTTPTCLLPRFRAWPVDALEAVALKFLNEMGGALDEPTRHALVGLCQAFHSRIATFSEEFLAVRRMAGGLVSWITVSQAGSLGALRL